MAVFKFKFETEEIFSAVWEELNDTAVNFTAYGDKEITVYRERDADMIREALEEAEIEYDEEKLETSRWDHEGFVVIGKEGANDN